MGRGNEIHAFTHQHAVAPRPDPAAHASSSVLQSDRDINPQRQGSAEWTASGANGRRVTCKCFIWVIVDADILTKFNSFPLVVYG